MLRSLPLLPLLFLLAAAPALAQEGDGAQPAPPTGVVTGRVANGTNGDLVPESGEPMLHVWDAAFQEKEMLHGELAPDGSFRFAAVWLYQRPVAEPAPATVGWPADFDTLVTEIALLDDAHDEGRVNEDDYSRRRKFLLSQAQQRMPQR